MAQHALYPELTGHSSTFPWLRHAIFIAFLMLLTILENGPYRVTTSQCELSSENDHSILILKNRLPDGANITHVTIAKGVITW